MTSSKCSSKHHRHQTALYVGAALVAVLVAGLVAGCSAIVTKKIGEGVCGDGIRGGEELCDGEDFGNQDCTSTGNGPDGYLVCDDDCTIDVQHCTGGQECGNEIWDVGEECDGTDLNGASCDSLGFDPSTGVLACDAFCKYNTIDCEGASSCGNGLLDGDEECDGVLMDGATCETMGYVPGAIYCYGNCTLDISQCGPIGTCGNGSVDSPEVCDVADLNGHTCESLGYRLIGNLGCGDRCQFDVTECESPAGLDVGRPCSDGLCSGDTCLSGIGGLPLGYCSHECIFNVCPGGGTCIVGGPGGLGPLCYETCNTYLTCQTGLVCAPAYLGTLDICWPAPSQ